MGKTLDRRTPEEANVETAGREDDSPTGEEAKKRDATS